jgi:MFS transporter, ACS family, allantoate permease
MPIMSDVEKKTDDAAAPPDVERAETHGQGEVGDVILKHADRDDADEALKAFAGGEVVTMTADEEKALLSKIDRYVMPLLCIVYGLNYLDKTTLSYASIMGMKTDIHLEGQEYSWIGSMFYFGYLVFEWPTNRLLQRLPLAKWTGFNVLMWGLVLACLGAVKSFGGAMAVRFFLGLFEAVVSPAFVLCTSQFYTIREQGTRVGFWFSFNGWGQIVGGAVAYGIAVGTQKHPLSIKPWQLLFLVLGLFTAALGVLFLVFMPDNQLNARFLTPRERIMAVERIRVNQQGVGNKHFKRYQFLEALTDPMVYGLVFYSLVADIPNGGITNFFSQLIVGFGFTNEQSLLLGIPGGAVEVVALVVCGYFGDKLKNRILVCIPGLLLAILGILLVTCLDNSHNVGKLIGYYLTQGWRIYILMAVSTSLT